MTKEDYVVNNAAPCIVDNIAEVMSDSLLLFKLQLVNAKVAMSQALTKTFSKRTL